MATTTTAAMLQAIPTPRKTRDDTNTTVLELLVELWEFSETVGGVTAGMDASGILSTEGASGTLLTEYGRGSPVGLASCVAIAVVVGNGNSDS